MERKRGTVSVEGSNPVCKYSKLSVSDIFVVESAKITSVWSFLLPSIGDRWRRDLGPSVCWFSQQLQEKQLQEVAERNDVESDDQTETRDRLFWNKGPAQQMSHEEISRNMRLGDGEEAGLWRK